MKLTEKQQAFAVNVAMGMKKKDAAVTAGYAELAASAQATKLLSHAGVKAAIRQLKRAEMSPKERKVDEKRQAAGEEEREPGKLKDSYPNSLALMQDTYNNPALPFGVRFEAAKTALPYEHGKIGEKGKKESAQERAEKVAGVGKSEERSRFAPKQPPKLHAVK